MKLIEEQFEFVKDVCKLISRAEELGYILTFGEAWRTGTQAWINSLPSDSTLIAIAPDSTKREFGAKIGGAGVLKSVHMSRLAVDFNIFTTKNPTRICTVEESKPLGDFWQSLNQKNKWGGNFIHPRPDAPHFERKIV